MRHVHLVGSVPLNDARAVFETVSAALGPRIKRIPDGETGERSDWITWLEPAFADNPALEKSAISCQSRSFCGSNLKSFEPLAERMMPSGVQTKSSLPGKVLVKTSAWRVLRSNSLISHSLAESL